ncbi:Phosphonate ABC transporter phosphate-binding periplasmic component (TC 3.A.1.9.1) [hydrothermal vent metagenome]|uniref:Phosphonate ABC transporter phosphate-binding periplasmic component (TC 3.A.1.9.1) n=1 Tax=hydrothermal vent metagenome TaxID=652676 RepID=A0A1W1B971_9ZZZZ
MKFINFAKKSLLPLFMVSTLSATSDMSSTHESLRTLPSGYNMIVAYYGRPNVKSMGILGEYSLPVIIEKVKARAKEYEKALGNGKHVTPGFDLIYEMATSSPGRDKKYVATLDPKILMKYINAAQRNGIVLFIDVQLGKKSPAKSVKPLLKYLKYSNVHIAIDPEFSVDDLKVRPGKKIGSITGKQINEVQHMMRDYIKANNIKDDKILLVHMFTEHMVTGKKDIRYTDRIHLAMHLDGHGSQALKVKTYNSLYTDARAAKVVGGFKVFLKEDSHVMSPKQVLGLEKAGGSKIKDMPKIVTYQ